MRKVVQRLQEFSIPLIAGVIMAMLWANVSPDSYHNLVHTPVHRIGTIFDHQAGHEPDHSVAETDGPGLDAGHESEAVKTSDETSAAAHGWDHYLTLHFLINDIFMALFFGIAAKEITEACLPNGALNPVRKAVNPLFGTVGGVVGPIGVFLLLNLAFGKTEWQRGWGIPTATDIALAWLVIKLLFGARHPSVSFLLLLAVADDAIGLGIIAFGYPDPAHPTEWMNLLWCVPGMALAFGLRKAKVHNWVPYIFGGGVLTWWGLYSAHLHPALALVFIVPFLPGPKKDLGLFVDDENTDHHSHSPLENFEHSLKLFVDLGLFFFALVNAGVSFGEVSGLSWIIMLSLVAGKMIGITLFSSVAQVIGFPLPAGMSHRHLIVTSSVAGLGLTVALFVCGQAFTDPALMGAAKMGAVFSVFSAVVALVAKVGLGVRGDTNDSVAESADPKATQLLEEIQELEKEVKGSAGDGSDSAASFPATTAR
ncbi:MAG: Na+/H+ antiporter NhaA [Planctomycetaceae bacterium]